MKKIILLIMATIMLSGCASLNKQAIDKSIVQTLKDKTITHTVREKPDFAAVTADKAAFALIGAVAMISAGNEIVAEHGIADPADEIAAGLAKALESRHGSQFVNSPVMVSEDDPALIAASTKGAVKYIIDTQTINWSFGYFPTDWSHYRVIYVAKARLIDVDTKAVVAEGFCKHVPESNEGAPTYDQLLANKASLLKKKLSDAAGKCVTSLKAEMLTI